MVVQRVLEAIQKSGGAGATRSELAESLRVSTYRVGRALAALLDDGSIAERPHFKRRGGAVFVPRATGCDA